MRICYQIVKNKYKLTPLPCLHLSWLRQALIKPLVLSVTNQLGQIFLSSSPLKSWKTLLVLKFSGVTKKKHQLKTGCSQAHCNTHV